MLHSAGEQTEIDSGIYCLGMLAHYHQLAAGPEQLKHQFGTSENSLDSTDLAQAAQGQPFCGPAQCVYDTRRAHQCPDLQLLQA